MMKRATGTAPALTRCVMTGVLSACGWAILCAAVIAKLLDEEVITMDSLGYCAMAAHVSAVVIGALTAKSGAGHMAGAAMGIAGAGYYLCLLLVNLLFFGGRYKGLGTTLVLVVLALGAVYLTEGKGRAVAGRKRYKIPR